MPNDYLKASTVYKPISLMIQIWKSEMEPRDGKAVGITMRRRYTAAREKHMEYTYARRFKRENKHRA